MAVVTMRSVKWAPILAFPSHNLPKSIYLPMNVRIPSMLVVTTCYANAMPHKQFGAWEKVAHCMPLLCILTCTSGESANIAPKPITGFPFGMSIATGYNTIVLYHAFDHVINLWYNKLYKQLPVFNKFANVKFAF